jgi:hypothetical protein
MIGSQVSSTLNRLVVGSIPTASTTSSNSDLSAEDVPINKFVTKLPLRIEFGQ